jgi:hypothetical protein
MAASLAWRKNNARRDKGLCTGCGESPCVGKNPRLLRERREPGRIETAIEQRNESELRWAAEYYRISARSVCSAPRKERSAYWLRIKARVAGAFLKLTSSSGEV